MAKEEVSGLKKEVAKTLERSRLGGFRTVGDKNNKVKYHFPAINGRSRQVVLKMNTSEKEPVSVYNINFKPNKLTMISGEIADAILRDFRRYFNVVAVSDMYDEESETSGFFEVEYDRTAGKYVPKIKNSELVHFDMDKLGLMSDEDRAVAKEAKAIRDEAEKMARIAKINAEALKIAKGE